VELLNMTNTLSRKISNLVKHLRETTYRGPKYD